ncbi:hypothetical protein [Flavobacterium dankookense]|uniref:Uncharacterized protein n=1 Tax=Flavobacterium dankookense TaxID=706186 RepID=A0A4R6QBJ4_9FLAO|nr:hypothetical protein [Flavobacterium dankookense]TDP60084.1 hypothetical protein BC748_1057 [Flavobacterium dankookense]
MSTQIKNTLYRFITMRAPELLEQEKSNGLFVLHPEAQLDKSETMTSSFLKSVYNIPIGKTKKEVLQEAVDSFGNNAKKTKKSVIELVKNPNLVSLAEWLTKNRANLTPEQVKSYLEQLGETDKLSNDEIRIKLWDNLFYQIFTFQSGAVRDFILSLLVADFFISNYKIDGENKDALRRRAQARVVVPVAIFSPENIQNNTVFRKFAQENMAVDKILVAANQSIVSEKQLKQFEELVLELVEIKIRYDKSESKQRAAYDKNYNALVQNAYQNANKIEKTYVNPVTKVEETYYEYENLVLPVYDYLPIAELEFIKNDKIATDNLKRFALTAKENKELDTFEELNSFAKEMIRKLNESLFNQKPLTEKVAVTGGAVIAARTAGYAARTSNRFTVSLTGSGTTKRLLLTLFGIEQGTDIYSGHYTVNFPNSEPLSGEYSSTMNESIWDQGNLSFEIFNYNGKYFQTTEDGAIEIEGTFVTNTGREISFSGTGSINAMTTSNGSGSNSSGGNTNSAANHQMLSPLLQMAYRTLNGNESYTVSASGFYTYEDPNVITEIENPKGTSLQNSGSTTLINNSTATMIDYIPTGYGIKRLGIADYRRVEQEVCCYVPGEVSHIENVMAREYKEKSTRRLRRQEDTLTTSKEKETEKLSDTTSTERFEMNQEVASVLAQQNSAAFHSGMSSKAYNVHFDVSADFAHNTTKETSNIQALNEAQEVTERVLERVVQKVKEERVTKIIEEYEENSKHGYDNRKGDKHISGVYRWVDKIMRNKVINYGKRLMYEFMIPEPASFHNAVMDAKKVSPGVEILEKPIDPRTAENSIALKIDNNFELRCLKWIEAYNVAVDEFKNTTIKVSKSFKVDFMDNGQEGNALNDSIEIPEGYIVNKAYLEGGFYHHGNGDNNKKMSIAIGNKSILELNNTKTTFSHTISDLENVTDKLAVSASTYDVLSASFNVVIDCSLTPNAQKKWRIETFNAIIAAYEARLSEYNDKVANAKAVQKERAKINPMFNRQVENIVLRKNCIEYLIGQAVLGKTSLLQGSTPSEIRAKFDDPALESYSAKVKFFEQAFEWDLMSYYFYPFYWAEKSKWVDMYQIDEMDDATFKAFLESGMARVIVTVRPGFEEAVNWFMATGQVWNGGQVPTMDDELFKSIVDELREQTGEVEETWESRVPTSLTVIQAGNIGLNVQGLPCDDDCDDYKLFDSDGNQILNPDGTPKSSNPLVQQAEDVLLGNVTENLDTVTENIEEIKADIESIQSTLESLAKN